jgi:hypothetical protein
VLPIRKTTPKRTCSKKYKNYRSYKEPLRKDFYKRCGYCGDLDVLFGGMRGSQIDHFRPKSIFTKLEHEYDNLVYACPYCNRAKSNDWPAGDSEQSYLDGKGYIDPCDIDYDNHLARYENGRIYHKTDVGYYMFLKLKLGLRRHQLAWINEQLELLLRELTDVLTNFSGDSSLRDNLANHHLELTSEYLKYKYLFEETL